MAVTDRDALRQRRRALQEQADALTRLLDHATALQAGDAAPEAVEALQRGLTELALAEELLRVQSEELIQTYAHLIEERERYRRLFEHAPIGFIVTDAQGMVSECNHRATLLLGRPRRRVLGQPLVPLAVAADRTSLREVLAGVAAGGRASGTLRLQHQEMVVHATAVADEAGAIDAVQLVLVPEAAARTGGEPLRVYPPAPAALLPWTVRVTALPRTGLAADRLHQATTASGGSLSLVRVPDRDDPVAAVLEAHPDVLVVDLTSARWRATFPALRRSFAELPIVVVVPDADPEAARGAVGGGADAVLTLGDDDRHLSSVLHAAAEGCQVFPRAVSDLVAEHVRHLVMVEALGERDRTLLRGVAQGATTSQLADVLHVSERTAKRHLRALMRQLDVDNRAGLAALAGRAGLAEETGD